MKVVIRGGGCWRMGWAVGGLWELIGQQDRNQHKNFLNRIVGGSQKIGEKLSRLKNKIRKNFSG